MFQILGIVVVGLVGYYFDRYRNYVGTPEVFFLLMAVTFLIGTFLLLLSCLISISTASIISKTVYVSIAFNTNVIVQFSKEDRNN